MDSRDATSRPWLNIALIRSTAAMLLLLYLHSHRPVRISPRIDRGKTVGRDREGSRMFTACATVALVVFDRTTTPGFQGQSGRRGEHLSRTVAICLVRARCNPGRVRPRHGSDTLVTHPGRRPVGLRFDSTKSDDGLVVLSGTVHTSLSSAFQLAVMIGAVVKYQPLSKL